MSDWPGTRSAKRFSVESFTRLMRARSFRIQSSLLGWWRAYWIRAPRPRFPNVPHRLTKFVRDHMEEYKRTGHRENLYLEAAAGVIAEYLHKNVFEEGGDPFLGKKRVNAEGDIWYGFPLRVILIGETLFLLRNCKGFPEICRRLQTRDLRPTYYEMIAAKAFFRAGFEIDVRAETRHLGRDFDFTASHKRLIVNVEVTALEEKEFYEKTAINALHQKRRQLPKDSPAVIFCVIPPQWEKIGKNLNEWSAAVANEFFLSGSRRVNRLVFLLEHHVDNVRADGKSGGFIIVSMCYDHPNPYFPCNLDSVFELRGSSDLMQLILENADDPGLVPKVQRESRFGEFYEWVDSFHDE